MAEGTERKKRLFWLAAFLGLLCLQVLLLIYYGNKKEGFHEDEYYSYYSTNRTVGLFEPDREWEEREQYRDEFVVLPGEGFRYSQVAMVQSWDVHPPFFYFILHTACSFFPGVFSKWLGIGVNIIAFCINFLLLSWLAFMVTKKDKGLTFAVAAVYGCNAVIISGVMFIRMYEWLTVFVLLCACLHVRAVINEEMGWKKFLLPLMAVNYLGFLTQYYYIIFLVFMAAGFCLWMLWKERKLKKCVAYGIACGFSLMLAVASYPACLSHIFRGYRGTGAASEFLDASNTMGRLEFFGGLLNEYLFNGWLWFWLLLIAVLALTFFKQQSGFLRMGIRQRKTENEESEEKVFGVYAETGPYFLLLAASLGYFFAVSKTALLLYETSNRYQLPVYGILLLLVMTAVYGLWNRVLDAGSGEGKKDWKGEQKKKAGFRKIGTALLLMLFFAGDIYELAGGKVIFLYEEDRINVEYARENGHVPVIVLYNDATPYHVWWCSQELMQYDKIYFASEGNLERMEDEIICGSNKLIVYAADYDTQEESLRMIQESNPALTAYKLVGKKGLWSIYEFE